VPNVQTYETTRLLRAWQNGDQTALDQLTPRVYQELRRLAHHHMQNERPGRTLQTTALVHEAFLRLVDLTNMRWQDRAHFFAMSATIMRRILVEQARARGTLKRGGNLPRISLDEIPDLNSNQGSQMLEVDDALRRMAEMDPRKARVIELRFFGGLSVEEAAEVLKISPQSVMRDWRIAKAWLMRELGI